MVSVPNRAPVHLRAGLLSGPIITAVAYFLSARLGDSLAFPSAPVSALWAPNAIVLAALLLARRDQWWLYLFAIFCFHLLAQLPEYPISQVLIQYLVNVGEALIGALALQRFCEEPLRFDRVRTSVVLIVFGGIISPVVTSVAMAGAFSFADIRGEFLITVLVRTLTNTFAIVTLVPLIVHGVIHLQGIRHRISYRRIAEGFLLVISLAFICYVVFVLPLQGPLRSPAFLYAPLPLLAWGAMRFGVTGACGAALVLGGISTWGALNGRGPFIAQDPVESALTVIAFNSVAAAALVLFAALIQDWKLRRMKAESLHAAVLASLHDQIAILDSTGRIVEINESWRRAVDSAPGLRFDRALPGVNLVDACARAAERGDRAAAEQLAALRAVLGGTEVRRQFECAGSEGDNPTWIEVSVEKLRRGEGGVVVTRTDVTARKQAELEARNQRLQLTHLGRAAILGQLSGAFAHELKQPLTSILGNAEAALRMLARGSNDPAELREILIDIVQDDERAAQVIQRLRSLLDKGDTVRQPVDLNQVIQEVLELARSELITRNVSVTTDFDRSAPIVHADRVQMQQVILNLLMNACEAMTNVPAAQRKIMVRTRFDRTGSFVEASVTDTGCGIPPADLERIFQPFVTTKGQGMGLGLAICRSVAQAHGGRLWAESTPGDGATFYLRIPTEGENS